MYSISRLNKHKKLILILSLVLVIFFLFTTSVYANKISSKIGSAKGEDIVSKVDQGGFTLVSTIRGIAVVVAVIMLVWFGITFFGSGGDQMKKAEAKSRLVWFFIALIFVFMAENIVATFSDFFGFSEYIR